MQLRFVLPDPLIPGQPFRGAVVVSPYWATPIAGVRVELHAGGGIERRYVSGPATLRAARHLFPFELETPVDVPERSIARVWTFVDALRWSFPTKGSWGVRASAAERALDPDAVDRTSRREDDWAEVARQLALQHPAPWVLAGQAGEVKFRIQIEGGQDAIVARLRYPSLGLGLRVSRAGDVGGEGNWIDVQGLRGWAWDLKQALAFLGRVYQPLLAVYLHRMQDGSAVVAGRLRQPGDLHGFARAVRLIALAIQTARGQIHPPTQMGGLVELWRGLATELEGEIDPPRMAITGRFAGGEVLIEPSLLDAGRHAATRIVYRPARPIAASLTFDSVGGDPPAAVRSAASALLGDALYLASRRNEIVVDLPATITEPDAVKGVLRRVSALATQLADAAPYR